MFTNNMAEIKNIVKIAIVMWIIIAIYYCLRTPYDQLSNDFWGHLQYTEIIATQHRLPRHNEGLETFQMPLYYLISSLVLPESLRGDKIAHINGVRFLSVLYGAISLFMIAVLLKQVTKKRICKH